jgi:predicted  nucleic acid-binding Zn-ribbon protein
MSTVKFTEDELQNIRAIQEEYSMIGIQLVQLKLARKSSEEYLAALEQEEQRIVEQIEGISTKEKQLTEALNEKYGIGSLDMTTGEFTPNS